MRLKIDARFRIRCNRKVPCDNCQKRDLEVSCHYIPTKVSSQDHHNQQSGCKNGLQSLRNRVIRLEAAFQDRQSPPHSRTANSTETNSDRGEESDVLSFYNRRDSEVMLTESNGTRSFNQNHWRAIMQSAVSKICHTSFCLHWSEAY